jgi:hypothetical protein
MSSHKRRGPTFDSKENRPRLCEPKCNKKPRRSFIRIQTRAIRTLIKQYSGASNGLMKLILSPATPIVYTNISLRHPWLAQEDRLKSLTDFCRFTSFVMEGHPFAPIRTQAFATVGDALFIDDNSTIIIDGNEIPHHSTNSLYPRETRLKPIEPERHSMGPSSFGQLKIRAAGHTRSHPLPRDELGRDNIGAA